MTNTPTDILELIQNNLEKFQRFNEKKNTVLYNSIADQRIIAILESIPLLLHTNIPGLPGYSESEHIPYGIANYHPSSKALHFISSLFLEINLVITKNSIPQIESLALMGSGGTIAYTEQSDFDFWICYDDTKINDNSVAALLDKCKAIEDWLFDMFNLEVHFFLNEIHKIKKNIFANDEENLSGTSIGLLLKEEFFRSSIIICGKIPFWWMVPVGSSEETYAEWLVIAEQSDLADRFIDIGNLLNIRHEDFISAALFQILKSLNSPFKSIIKLGLLRRYLNNINDNPFISTIIKKNMHAGLLDTIYIDAYIIMFNQVFYYYYSINPSSEDIEIIKTSLYLKVKPDLTTVKNETVPSEKTKIMQEYINSWNWSVEKIRHLDNFQNWGINLVNSLLQKSKTFILTGYKDILAKIEMGETTHRFSAEELQAISRKIHSHFTISDNIINNSLSFKNYPHEKQLKIEYSRNKEGRDTWFLSKRNIKDEKLERVILYQVHDLFNLVVWISLNGLYKENVTRLEIDPGIHAADTNYLRELISFLSKSFRFKKIQLYSHFFLKDSFPIASCIIFNPMTKYAQDVEEIYLLYYNSWGITKFDIYKDRAQLPDVIKAVLSARAENDPEFDFSLQVSASPPFCNTKEYYILRQKLYNIFAFFNEWSNHDTKARYITKLNNQYVLFYSSTSNNSTTLKYTSSASNSKIFYGVSFNNGQDNSIKIDPLVPELLHVRKIVEHNRHDCIQIYFFNQDIHTHFYISDERNALVYARKNSSELFTYLTSLYLFGQHVIDATTRANPASQLSASLKKIHIYQVKAEGKDCSFNEIDPQQSIKIQETINSLTPTVLSIRSHNNQPVNYKFSLPDGSTTDFFQTTDIKQLTTIIRQTMAQFSGFSFYLTGIDLSEVDQQLAKDYTSYSFSEKNRFELIIESLLRHIAEG